MIRSANPETTIILSANGALTANFESAPLTVEQLTAPTEYVLMPNYPNPFNPSTTIGYTVPGTGSRHEAIGNGWVRLSVYDILGREVAVLVNEKKAPGSYTVRFDAGGLASGVYLYRLTAGGFSQTRTMALTR